MQIREISSKYRLKYERTFTFKNGISVELSIDPVSAIWSAIWRGHSEEDNYRIVIAESNSRSIAVKELRLKIAKLKNPDVSEVQWRLVGDLSEWVINTGTGEKVAKIRLPRL